MNFMEDTRTERDKFYITYRCKKKYIYVEIKYF